MIVQAILARRVPFAVAALLLIATLLAGCGPGQKASTPRPYDEAADAKADIEAALVEAGQSSRLLLLIFGANWCPDCRALAAAMEEPPLRDLVADRFVVVHVDVGKWDRNMDVVKAWGDPTGHGIPSLAVAGPDRQILFVTRQGEISRVRRMGDDQVLEFFRLLAALG